MTVSDRPEDRVLWRAVAETIARVVQPALATGDGYDSARQLEGLARYALTRPPDPGPARVAELASTLGLEADLLPVDVLRCAGQRSDEVRALLRAYLEEDIATAAPLLDTFSGHAVTESEPDVVTVPESAALEAWLTMRLGAPLEKLEVAVMVGGHSRRMLSLTVTTEGAREHLVARIEQGGMFGTSGEPEARLMQTLSTAGFPVARVRWIERDDTVLGQPFFVMDRLAGSPAVDDRKLDDYISSLADLHRLDIDRLNPAGVLAGLGPAPTSPQQGIVALIDHWLGVYRASVELPIPLLEDAAVWLRTALAPTGPTCIVHGDPGPGNFLHDGTRITGLTDWELAHWGDAAEDWTYFGAIRARKLHDVTTWRARFASVADVHIDDHAWACWEVFNQFKGACVNLTALRLFRTGVITTPNLLAIGTAVHLRFLARLTELIENLRADAQTGATEPGSGTTVPGSRAPR